MSKLDKLLSDYKRFIALPWQENLAGDQKVIFGVYDKTEERSLRCRLEEFAIATQDARHQWQLCDLTDAFPTWIAQEEYRESYFQSPEDLELLLPQFKEFVVQQVCSVLSAASEDTVVALAGLGSLFGFLLISDLIAGITPQIQGRLLVLFPGGCDQTTYRFLDAREGWNYMAVRL